MKWLNSNRMRLVAVGIDAGIVFSAGNVKANFTLYNRSGGYCNFDLMSNGAYHVFRDINSL
jgi:hypothetical protein